MAQDAKKTGTGLVRLVVGNLLVFALLIALVEVGGRLFGPPPPVTGVDYFNDPKYGNRPLPNQRTFHNRSCYANSQVSTNSAGMRDRPRQKNKTPGTYRVAVLGDSMTEGVQVPDDATFTRVLEERVPNTEFLNFGASSIGTAVELLQYRALARAYAPDAVLLMFFFGNDVEDNHPPLKKKRDPIMGAITPYLVSDGEGLRLESGVHRTASWKKRWLRKLWLGQWLTILYYRITLKPKPAPAADNERSEVDRETHEQAFQLTLQILRTFHREVREDQRRFVLALVPDGGQALGRDGQLGSETTRYYDRVVAFARAEGIEMVDLVPPLLKRARAGELSQYSFPCDGHWDVGGHAAVAEILAPHFEPSKRNDRPIDVDTSTSAPTAPPR